MRKKLGTFKVHSTIDVITNSSTEIFCTVEATTQEAVQDVIDTLFNEFECCKNGILMVEPHIEEYGLEERKAEGQFDIIYEYGCKPCKLIRKRLEELFTIINIIEE